MKKRFLKLLKSNWTITLVATTIGVYLGAFINDYYAEKSEIRKAEKAFQNVLTELDNNYESLVEWDSISQENYNFFEIFSEYALDSPDELTLTVAEMNRLTSTYPTFIEILDSTQIQADTFTYEVEVSLNFQHEMIFNFQYEIAWSAIKSTDYLRYIDFSCIKNIEFIYKMLDLSSGYRKKWFNKIVYSELENEEDRDKILLDWNLENQANKQLIALYPQLSESLNVCI